MVEMKKNKILPNFDLFLGYFGKCLGQMGVLGDWVRLNIIYELNLTLIYDHVHPKAISHYWIMPLISLTLWPYFAQCTIKA